MRGDSESRANYYDKMLKNGVYSINEVRKMEEMNKIDHESANGHYKQVKYVSLSLSLSKSLLIDSSYAMRYGIKQYITNSKDCCSTLFNVAFSRSPRKCNGTPKMPPAIYAIVAAEHGAKVLAKGGLPSVALIGDIKDKNHRDKVRTEFNDRYAKGGGGCAITFQCP
jgi:hypothetical protein